MSLYNNQAITVVTQCPILNTSVKPLVFKMDETINMKESVSTHMFTVPT